MNYNTSSIGSLKPLKVTGKIALDTNAVIAYLGGNSQVVSLIEEADIIILPVIVLGELIYGALNSTKIKKNEQALQHFVEYCHVVPLDDTVASRYARVRLKLKKSGNPIPENDIWIAAMCLELDLPLISQDVHFTLVEGLNVIPWDKT